MKKTFIGASIFIGGILELVGILIVGTISKPENKSWSESLTALFHWILQSGNKGSGLGFLYIFGLVLTIFGLVILIVEYFKKEEIN